MPWRARAAEESRAVAGQTRFARDAPWHRARLGRSAGCRAPVRRGRRARSLLAPDHREKLHASARHSRGHLSAYGFTSLRERLDDGHLEGCSADRILKERVEDSGTLGVRRAPTLDIGVTYPSIERHRAARDRHLAEAKRRARSTRAAPDHHGSDLRSAKEAIGGPLLELVPGLLHVLRRRLGEHGHPALTRALFRHRGYFLAAASFLATSSSSRTTWYLPSSAGTKPPTHAPISLKASGCRTFIVVSDS